MRYLLDVCEEERKPKMYYQMQILLDYVKRNKDKFQNKAYLEALKAELEHAIEMIDLEFADLDSYTGEAEDTFRDLNFETKQG